MTHDHTNYDPGTADTPEPRGGETTEGGATRRQLEPEPDRTLSQRTDYSATSRTASNVTRQRTLNQNRTEYSRNTYYSHITQGDACDPKQDPAPSQHTDYSDRITSYSTNAAPCRRTPSPNHTEYSAQDTDHCGTPHHEAPHCDNRDGSPGTRATNGVDGRGDNTTKPTGGPHTRSTAIRVQLHLRHRDGRPLPTTHLS